ncbi:MAG: peptide ABC transporter substrate-binding protein [Deltaproteobacteria bacterium]|nr:peptide ABC transporter substrate-binding protein [Deltaproteobacteria bacterium]
MDISSERFFASITLRLRTLLVLAFCLFLTGCTNNPYRSSEVGRNIYYDTFTSEPKHLDPARAYSADEYEVMNQIYEPLVQYHFLKRPYVLAPLTTTAVPEAKLYDKDGNLLTADAPAEAVARVVYEITLRSDVRYQEHPAFAQTADGKHRWHLAVGASFPKIDHPNDLPEKGARELHAEDYAYQIKRLAHPLLDCPIFPVLTNYIAGFAELRKALEAEITRIRTERRQAAGVFYNQEADERTNPIYLDLRQYELPGVQVVDAHTVRITLTRKYPQFVYWLAMPFFSPIPWEVDRFYTQAAAREQNITLDRFPVGTGPFTLAVNQPNYRMVLRRNTNFHEEFYPEEGAADDEKLGLLADRGKPLPFLEEAVFVLEKESVSQWNKFLQGYYDNSGIGSEVFDQAIQIAQAGGAELTPVMREKALRLLTAVTPSIHYYAFNMLDDVVGGYDDKKRKLRQAIAIALNEEEYIQIFANGRGIAAQGPIPPDIFGYQEGKAGINPIVYEWDERLNAPRRKSLEVAKHLLAEAGYPGGRDASGKPLVLFFDTAAAGAGAKSEFDWLRKQFAALDLQLQVRSTDYNRFQEKVLKGDFQILRWGWNADYPDPENFLFLLYGPNGKVKSQGENAANYDNPRFNALFQQVENMTNSPERAALIQEMVTIAREDAPWIWSLHAVGYGLYHEWYQNTKPMAFGGNTLKYKRVDTQLRETRRLAWNKPVTTPLWVALGLLVASAIPATIALYRRERGVTRGVPHE